MALRTTYDGKGFQPGYAGIEAQVFLDADRQNGNVKVPDGADGEIVPRLTNGQVIAMATAWKRAAARSKAPAWPEWYTITIAALGWRNRGDRFVMTKDHAQTPADPGLLQFYWRAAKALAERLDASATKHAPLIVSYAWDGYEQAARDAWHTMQIEDGGTSKLDPLDDSLIEVEPVKPADSSGWGGAILLIALLIAAGMASKKR